MAMEKLTQDNVFVGSIVFRGKEKFYVYKVNAKSLYIGKEKEKVISNKWENKHYKIKWSDFMSKNGGEKTPYAGLTISTEEANKKSGFLAIKEARESTRDWLGKAGKKAVKELFEMSRDKVSIINGKKVVRQKGKDIRLIRNDVGKNQIYIIKMRDDGHILLRLNDAYLFYDINTEIYTRYNEELHKDGKKIVFPEKIVPALERKTAV